MENDKGTSEKDPISRLTLSGSFFGSMLVSGNVSGLGLRVKVQFRAPRNPAPYTLNKELVPNAQGVCAETRMDMFCERFLGVQSQRQNLDSPKLQGAYCSSIQAF